MSDLFLGRFMPPTKAHMEIIEQMNDPVVCIVSGIKSRNDRKLNPFTSVYSANLIRSVFPDVKIVVAETGYAPDIIGALMSDDIKIDRLFCGTDRVEGYRRQLDILNKGLVDKNLEVSIVEVCRNSSDISSTKVRESLIKNDFDQFKSLMNESLYGEFENMKDIISEEGEGGGPTNAVGNGAVSDHPKPFLGMVRRKYSQFMADLEKNSKKIYDKQVKDEEKAAGE